MQVAWLCLKKPKTELLRYGEKYCATVSRQRSCVGKKDGNRKFILVGRF